MPRIYVHDFKFEYTELKNRVNEEDFFCGLTVYFNFSKEDPGSGWDNLEYFYVSVATPFGLSNHLRRCIDTGIYPKISFFPHLLVVDKADESEIMSFIKTELQSIYGRSEKELILKAIRKFDWESEAIPEVYEKLFK